MFFGQNLDYCGTSHDLLKENEKYKQHTFFIRFRIILRMVLLIQIFLFLEELWLTRQPLVKFQVESMEIGWTYAHGNFKLFFSLGSETKGVLVKI